MNFNMKNRIWKNLSAMSMAFFMTGMVLGGCGQTTVYAAELAYESVEFEEHSETEETGIEEAGIEESGTDESDPDEIQGSSGETFSAGKFSGPDHTGPNRLFYFGI